MAAAFDAAGCGAIVNNSRGIIFAHSLKPYAERFGAARWQEAVEAATRDMIEQLRAATPSRSRPPAGAVMYVQAGSPARHAEAIKTDSPRRQTSDAEVPSTR